MLCEHGLEFALCDTCSPSSEEEKKNVINILDPKAKFSVIGIQVVSNGKIQGTALYAKVSDARRVRDILNKKYAELKVNTEAKLVNYPVY